MTARFTDHLLEGDHASIPAAASAPVGTLYACSTHGLIYKNDGAAWNLWATLGNAAGIDSTTAQGLIDASIDALKGGVSAAYDTLLEIEAELDSDDTAAAALVAEVALKAYISDLSKRVSNVQAGAYTLALTDAGKHVRMTSATPVALTVPLNSSVAFPVDTFVDFSQFGAGQVTVTPVSGAVTLHASPGLKTAAQYAVGGLHQVAVDEWLVYGRLSA